MARNSKLIIRYALFGMALLIAVSSVPVWNTASYAKTKVTFRPPGTPAPRSTTGGASRDSNMCGFSTNNNSSNLVTPLLPDTNIGLTTTERPNIFVYIPQTIAKKAFFSVQDDTANHYYQTTIDLPEKPGVMEIKLPDSAPKLKTNKNYKWSLAMICGESLEPDSPLVSGWIRRVEKNHNLSNQLSNQQTNQASSKNSLESVSKLASNGLWYDSLSALAQLRREQPSNQTLVDSWQELLTSADLNKIAKEPLIN
jgi:Domain of Unknown Function (DUF928)